MGEAGTQKEAGFLKKKITLLEVSNANGEFNISVHILRQKFDQYVGGKVPNHFERWVKIAKDSFVLDIVRSGRKIDFFKRPVCYNIKPSYSMSDTEKIPLTVKLRSCCRKGSLSQLPVAKGIFCEVFLPG